jgi:hypothetical protein
MLAKKKVEKAKAEKSKSLEAPESPEQMVVSKAPKAGK